MAAIFFCQACFRSFPMQHLFFNNAQKKTIFQGLKVNTSLLFGVKRKFHADSTSLWKSTNTVTCKLQPNFFNNLLMGFSAGCIASLVGAGGGVLLTPFFVTFYGLKQREAQGTSLVAVSFSSLVASLTYLFGRRVLLVPSMLITLTAIFTARVGAKATMKIENTSLRRYFGLLLILLSLFLPLRYHLQASLKSVSLPAQNKFSFLCVTLYMFAGTIAGFLSGLLGIGGGIILVPFLAGVLGVPQHFAQGTALFGMLVPSFSGSFVHWSQQNVDRKLLPGVIAGIIFGAFVGSNIALSVSERMLRIMCSIVFFLIGFRFFTASK
ncbi:hypothetical protein GAYE_SCF00G1815 [Galdieria yellowstonensis]|uniref:Membrane transporter protein n=1 Tax=Galdieria yellowstonensis TaxID=3028027 RepID=A0AAV9I953_9RHOD|nr:hypothetical protein GAYE_SCF00G1815 [Galdieria yellowstonensis]